MDDDDGIPSSDVISVDQNGIPVYQELVVPDLLDVSSLCEHDGPRLLISYIVNENFKSYAGIKKLGPFHKNFSAIIGPNGSGKSNVIDSMLFVFGYRASKIRSKKISVLIHNSETRSNIESCTVSVYFQKIFDEGSGNNDYKVVEGSEFVVSRTAFRDNSSFYKINNRKVQYKEVESYLKEVGVDLVHNRFLILQGEVEQIALMKPKSQNKNEDGMLEFLEDIIGSSRFKEPIEVLARRIEELGELKTEKYNRLKAIEKEKNDLEEEKNEAIEYLEIENSIIKKKSVVLQKNMLESEKLERESTEIREEIVEKLKSFETQLVETTSKKKLRVNESKDFIKKFKEITGLYEDKKEEFSKFEHLDVRCQEDMKHCRIKCKKLDATFLQEEAKLKEYKLIPEKQEKDVEELTKKLVKLQAEKQNEEEKFNEVMSNFQDETKDLQKEKEMKEKELSEHQKIVNSAKQQYQVTQAELDLFKSNQTKESAKLTDIRRSLESTQNTLTEKMSALNEVDQKLPDSTEALEKAKKDLSELCNSQHEREDMLKQLRMKVEIARTNLQTHQNQGRVLEFLMNLKRSGRTPGIYGRLGDLGAIDEKYNVAISTACSYLDYIVVDDMDTAQKCMEALKSESIGQASFIGLDHMAKWKEFCSKKINPPENVPRLFELIKVSNKEMLPAFYFGLRDTLAAKDLEQATRIAYGSTRYRVVTLGGQLIDLSGTMSGGGNKVIKGKMGSSIASEIDPKVLGNMERDLDKISREVSSCQENRFKLQEMVDKLQKSHRELTHAGQKLRNEIKNIQEQLLSFQKQEKEQEQIVAASALDKKKLQKMEKNVEDLKKDYEKVQKVASNFEDEIHEIHKQIMEIGGKELKSIETRMGLLNTQIDQLSTTITKINVAIRTAQRNTSKCEAKVESLKQEIAENKNKMIDLEKEKLKIEAEAHEVLIDLSKSEGEMKIYEVQLTKVNGDIAKFDEKEQEIKRQQIQVRHTLEKAETDERECKEKTKSYKRSLSELSLNQINEGEKLELQTYLEDGLKDVDCRQVLFEISSAQDELSRRRPNMAAITEYRKKEDLYMKKMAEMTHVSNLKDQQRKHFDEFRKRRLDEFMAGFRQITNKLKEMYQMITLGGDAELELVDSLDPFSEGIVFSVRPPNKSWKNISNLSGGEKTLSSLALVFALHHFKPTPFYVMDEIDAALDFRNVSIVAHYIKDRTKNAQFIVISLRNNMYELCDRLVGIYKTNNCTHSVVINPHTISCTADN